MTRFDSRATAYTGVLTYRYRGELREEVLTQDGYVGLHSAVSYVKETALIRSYQKKVRIKGMEVRSTYHSGAALWYFDFEDASEEYARVRHAYPPACSCYGGIESVGVYELRHHTQCALAEVEVAALVAKRWESTTYCDAATFAHAWTHSDAYLQDQREDSKQLADIVREVFVYAQLSKYDASIDEIKEFEKHYNP